MSDLLTRNLDASRSKSRKVKSNATVARLFFLDLSEGRGMSCNPDGSDLRTLVSQAGHMPDGVVVDENSGHIYWTNMGTLSANDGSNGRADLAGNKLTTIVPAGGTHTAKQLQLHQKNRKLYRCDRD